jgi:hypothetical protein
MPHSPLSFSDCQWNLGTTVSGSNNVLRDGAKVGGRLSDSRLLRGPRKRKAGRFPRPASTSSEKSRTHSRLRNTKTDARQVWQEGAATERASCNEVCSACRDSSLGFRDCSSERVSRVAENATRTARQSQFLRTPVVRNVASCALAVVVGYRPALKSLFLKSAGHRPFHGGPIGPEK